MLGKAPKEPTEEPATEPKAEAKPADKADAKPAERPPEGDVPEAARATLGKLLADGKLGELAEKLGVDRKAVDVSSGKLSLSRKRMQEAEAKERNATEMQAECKRLYGDPHKARLATDAGRFAEAAEYFSRIVGMDFATFTRHVAGATKGMAPEELARFQKERELARREKELNDREGKAQRERTEEERIGKACKTIETKLTGHDALKLKGGSRRVYAILNDHFDPKSGQLSIGYQKAADMALAEFRADADALGYTKGGKAPEPEQKPSEARPDEPRGKKPFAPAEAKTDEPAAGKRRGMTMEERSARADRNYQRSRPL